MVKPSSTRHRRLFCIVKFMEWLIRRINNSPTTIVNFAVFANKVKCSTVWSRRTYYVICSQYGRIYRTHWKATFLSQQWIRISIIRNWYAKCRMHNNKDKLLRSNVSERRKVEVAITSPRKGKILNGFANIFLTTSSAPKGLLSIHYITVFDCDTTTLDCSRMRI